MDNMEYIDDFFKGLPTDEQKQQFEQRIINDISFAEEVAFYVSATGAIKEQLTQEKKMQFRRIYKEQQKVIPITKQPVKKIVRYLAAASLVATVLLSTWLLSGDKTTPAQLANQYIQQNFQTLNVTMSGRQDSLQSGLILFNSGNLKDALVRFENIIKKDPANYLANKYAGIISLRLEYYDKALEYFTVMEADTTLFSNHGKFYKAVTLLKRNENGDKESAKMLLIEVKEHEMEGSKKAAEWLKVLNK
ncbi:MAG: hypothetical protein ABI760_04985 [Ferruginibacter sp.]